MNPYPVISKKLLIGCTLFVLVSLMIWQLSHYVFFMPKIVFCDVGQGDSALMQVSRTFDILIDAGPGRKVLDCLNKHIPYFDRTIELVIITHPDFDHFGGMLHVLPMYKVNTIAMPPIHRDIESFQKMQQLILSSNTTIVHFYFGDTVTVDSAILDFYWPPQELFQLNPETNSSSASSMQPNDLSIVFLLSYNNERILFTGDLHVDYLENITQHIGKITTLKVSHHGAKNGLSEQIVDHLKPNKAVISVGEKNSYGHPHTNVLEILKSRHVDLYRTDHDGSIIFNLD